MEEEARARARLMDVPIEQIRRTNRLTMRNYDRLRYNGRVIAGRWPFPPVLLVELQRVGKRTLKRRYVICDGNHRTAVARRTGRKTIRAWVVTQDDLNAALAARRESAWHKDDLFIEDYVKCGRSNGYPHRS